MTTGHYRPIIAVWSATDDEPATVRVFDPFDYADWAETNCLTDGQPYPVRFYGITDDGQLVELNHSCDVSPYDGNDYALVSHGWKLPGGGRYEAACAQRDGRA